MYKPKKVYVLENGGYTELSYGEFCRRLETDLSYADKLFLPLHGMLMEVSKADYEDFYRQKRRQKYMNERSRSNGDVSYDRLIAEGLSGWDALPDSGEDVGDQVVRKILLEKLDQALLLLSEGEMDLIRDIFYSGMTERDLAIKHGVSQVAIHKRKKRILEKLKKIFES